MNQEKMPPHIEVGRQGEDIAARYITQRGWRIVARNFRAGRGEIDCIAWDGHVLVFAEVKTRRNARYGMPREAVTAYKQQMLRRTAQAYLLQHDCTDTVCRFDVIEVMMEADGAFRVTCWENAF